ncbi:MFS transporter [Rhodococcus sp. ACS1]|uniref:MFS transporter n=1 Tax=Rhodococcus sp. ACS1 TaxID=2028570 RepID=UPI000BB14399|nr:MFS transporter [Rhodococcus sp. ACS1]PBC35338.1 MFS transporter [Rhodococcus sp. ACS1]
MSVDEPTIVRADGPLDAGSSTAGSVKARRAVIAGALGTLMEYYDYGLYGFMAVIIAPLFFPSSDPTVSLLATLAVLGTGYVVRPLGGIFFGILGDRRGRRLALVCTVVGISAASAAIGMLPTHAQIGIFAPILLILARLVQGFSAGGELAGSATYISESAPPRRRAFYASFNLSGLALGFATAATTAGVVSALTTPEQMSSWGWRIPFLIAVPLGILAMWARNKLEDTPEFREMAENDEVVKSPVREVIRKNPFEVLKVAGVSFAMNGAGNIGLIYMSVYLVKNVGFNAGSVYWLAAIVIGSVALIVPLAGTLADSWGRRPAMAIGLIGFLVLSYPVMLVMEKTSSLVVAGLAYFVFMVPWAFLQAPAMQAFTEMFPRRYRYTGVALGFNIGTVLVGGTAPYLAAQFAEWTGNQQSAAFVVMTVCGIGLIALLRMRETARDKLPV